MSSRRELIGKVEHALNQIRPFLEEDGGDMTLVEITDDLIVKIALHGACSSCSMVEMTMKAGVEETIRKAAPEIRAVEAVKS